MNQLTLEWLENAQVKTASFGERQPSKQPGLFRIGRDPAQCDLVLPHQTVSGLHVEIFFDPNQSGFFLRNLRQSNPPLIDRQRVTHDVVSLSQGSTIQLGLVELKVAIVKAIPATVVSAPPANRSYGLSCPNCHRISAYDHLERGCAWCGTSLAAADSVLLQPGT